MGEAEVEKPDLRSKEKAYFKIVKKILLLKEAFSKKCAASYKKDECILKGC